MLKKRLNIICFNFNFQNVKIVWFNIDNPNNKMIFQQAYNYKEKIIHYTNEFHSKLIFPSQNKQTHVQISSCFYFVFFLFPLMFLFLCFHTWWWSLVVYHTQGECFRLLVQHFFVVTFFKGEVWTSLMLATKDVEKMGTQWCGNHPPIGHMAS